MTSYTVTATNSDGSHGIALQVEVITGAIETGGGSASVTNGATGTFSVTPNFSASFIACAVNNAGGGVAALTPSTNNKLLTVALNTDSYEDTVNGVTYGAIYYSGTVTGGSGVTVGYSNSSGTSAPQLAAYEIQPSPAWAEDASTPAYIQATGAAAVTSASFSPPGGAVLVAIAACNFATAGSGSDITIASTPSLTWTMRAENSTSANGGAAVWTATVPGSPAAVPNPGPLPNFPVTIVSNAGWRGAGHSR